MARGATMRAHRVAEMPERMIPGPLISWPFLLLVVLLPLLGAVLTLALLVYALYFFLIRKGRPAAFFSGKMRVWCALVVLTSAWSGFLLYQQVELSREQVLQSWYRESRRQFVLPQDFQYGDLPVPKGSLINRYDAFDNGEPQRPLGLRGLRAIRFAAPVQLAGVWASALEAYPAKVMLARDQRIGPVYHYDAQQRDWVPDPSRPFMDCKAGDIARFEVPSIDYDIQAEFLVGEPDGPAARFKPGQWKFTRCGSDSAPIEVKPALAEPPPEGAQRQVFSAAMH